MSVPIPKDHKTLEVVYQPEGDDNELCVLCAVFNIVGHDGDVSEIQSGVDLVHEVQRSGLCIIQCAIVN